MLAGTGLAIVDNKPAADMAVKVWNSAVVDIVVEERSLADNPVADMVTAADTGRLHTAGRH